MKQLGPFSLDDLLRLKWRFLLALIALLLAVGLYLYAQQLNAGMNTALRTAQTGFRDAQRAVDQIEDEEATIIEYIDRYQQLDAENIVSPEDRLQLLETVTDIRMRNNLFPIALNISEQRSIPLQYDPAESDPGGPVELHVSQVDLSLPLLHEADLLRLLNGLLDSPGLHQLRNCSVSLRNPNTRTFLSLGQHQNADCSLLWYTFDVTPGGQG